MRRRTAHILAPLLIAALAVGLSACGSGGAELLPGTTASQINENLDQVRQLAGEGECNGAEEAAGEVSLQVEEVSGVDPELKTLLDEGAEKLSQVVGTCEEAESEEEPAESEEEALEGEEEEEPPTKEKPEKTAPEKETESSEPPGHEVENPGKAKGHEKEPPAEEAEGEAPSGGVGPGAALEGE